jgi:alcohol dehydrogenase class IV
MKPDYDLENVFSELEKGNRRERRLFGAIIALIVIIAACFLFSGCTVTTRPDGATTYETSPDALLYAIEAWAAAKATPVTK